MPCKDPVMVQSDAELAGIERQTDGSSLQNAPYSTFSKLQKRWIVLCIAVAGMFSPLSSFIYYPAVHSLATDLRTSIETINLSITVYMIVSGITPSLLGDAADQIGRRPVYIFAFVIYFFANIGLALQQSYAALLVLRMMQSLGSSGTIAIGYGVIADIAARSERGSYVGVVLCGPNIAPSLGPVLGAVLADQVGWRWIFWFLCVFSSVCLAVIIVALPETARNVVGNGAVPAKGVNRDLLSVILNKPTQADTTKRNHQKKALHIPNPMTCLSAILYRDTAIILLTNAIFYMVYCCIQASLSSSFISIYHYNELQAGLIYLPFGFGCAVASIGSGKLMDRDYRIVAKRHNLPVERACGNNLCNFPIEEARLKSIWYPLVIVVIAIAGYGWSVQTRTHVAVPLVLQFLIGAATTGIFNICGTFLVDLHSHCPATVSASANLIRCTLSASGLAVLQILIDNVGVGWCFSILAAIAAIAIPLLLMESKWGAQWRSIGDKTRQTSEATLA